MPADRVMPCPQVRDGAAADLGVHPLAVGHSEVFILLDRPAVDDALNSLDHVVACSGFIRTRSFDPARLRPTSSMTSSQFGSSAAILRRGL
jgi:hypothetical protein